MQSEDGFTYPIQVQVNREALGEFQRAGQAVCQLRIRPDITTISVCHNQADYSRIELQNLYMGKDNAEITADLMPGYTASDIKTYIDQEIPKLLKDAQGYAYNGVVKELTDSQTGTQLLFFLALVFIYLILAAQFESFVDPLIIMLTVPLCIVGGALLTLTAFGQSMNIYSKIGLLTLVGLVTKHGILLVEFANEQRKQGIPAIDAALNSARSRLRPILMTSLTMILGALPLALASGPGSLGAYQYRAGSRRRIGCRNIFLFVCRSCCVCGNGQAKGEIYSGDRQKIKQATTGTVNLTSAFYG